MPELKYNFLWKNRLLKYTLFLLIIISLVQVKSISKDNSLNLKNEEKNFNNNPKNYNSKLIIFDNKNNIISEFMVAKADTKEKQKYGLMYLKELPQNYGMIFTFRETKLVNMWMKNTYIPLDMLFIDENNIIKKIIHNTIPHSLEIISSITEINKVLEINAGLSKKLNINEGYKIKF